jgi:two-component system probable response regulator PhcQ
MSESEALTEKKTGTILFVDDEPLSQKYFEATVGKYANVRTASSADAALKILQDEGNDITVVVSDERMPRESGVSFLSDVRKSWPSTIRVLTSAYANIDNLQHAINDAAIYRFVPKPWNLDELCAAMQDALHAERSASTLAEPFLGPVSDGDAKDANIALLAILANGFDAPLKSLDAEAFELLQLSGQGAVDAQHTGPSYLQSWSSRLRQSKIAAASSQVQKDVEHCQSLASSISRLAHSLVNPDAMRPTSMADTLLEVLEQNINGSAKGLSLDPSQDFTYQMPREIMKFVLTNLLPGCRSQARQIDAAAERIALVNGAAHNELRLTLGSDQARPAFDDNQTWRTIRSALWAFGGELRESADEKSGSHTIILGLPKAN